LRIAARDLLRCGLGRPETESFSEPPQQLTVELPWHNQIVRQTKRSLAIADAAPDLATRQAELSCALPVEHLTREPFPNTVAPRPLRRIEDYSRHVKLAGLGEVTIGDLPSWSLVAEPP
jgi:hypothetical protein